MIFSSIATLAAPSTENGEGEPTLSSRNPCALAALGRLYGFDAEGGELNGLPSNRFGKLLALRLIEPSGGGGPRKLVLPSRFVARRRSDFRISSSRWLVASLRLSRSVALSLLLLLRAVISF